MPLLEIVKPARFKASIRLDETPPDRSISTQQFFHASVDDVVDEALAYAFAKDRDFQELLRTSQAAHVSPSLRIRHFGKNSAEPASGAVNPPRLMEAARDLRPRS